MEHAIAMRVAFNGDKEAWQSFCRQYSDPDSPAPEQNDAEAFQRDALKQGWGSIR